MPAKYYLTTPLYYVNSRPHIGHSYTNIAADTIARFKRLEGFQVLFLTGTDEHGQKIDKAAQDAGMAPKEYVDKISETFKDLWKVLNITYDDFIRTTEDRHVQAVQTVWRELNNRDVIYQSVYSGYYCTPDETFWTDRQVTLENGKVLCPDCKRPVDKIEEDNYFFKISMYQSWLIETIKKDELKILPVTRKNEVLGFLENNVLQDLCISRPKNRLAWGIQSPLSENHVTYVWFDALINYISAVGYGVNIEKFEKWWPADVHLIGKDILRHHAVYWPILLHALGAKLPKMVFAHGWWVQGGEKMSKSRGNVVDPVDIVKRFGVDPYRYFLLSEAPFGQDGVFSEEALTDRFNRALANDLGNLLHRTLTMCEKYFEGMIPEVDFTSPDKAASTEPVYAEMRQIRDAANALPGKMSQAMSVLEFDRTLDEIWRLISLSNKYIENAAPWTLAKQEKHEELRTAIATLLETLKIIAQAVWPFMPATGEAILVQLGISQEITKIPFKDNGWGYFKKGSRVKKGAPLFPRIEVEKKK